MNVASLVQLLVAVICGVHQLCLERWLHIFRNLESSTRVYIRSIISKVGIKQNVTHTMMDGEAVKE